jgi:GDSL-like lipase/acylhydrolase family protein
MISKPLHRALILVTGLIIFFSLTATRAFADCPIQGNPPAHSPLQMLVLGDSIMWGQGLKPEKKSWWRVKCWLQEKTGREVRERIEAHSGALISAAPTSAPRFISSDGEVNLPSPTVNEQLDHAISFYARDGSKADLILVNGCANDVGVSNLLNAAASPDAMREAISARCGADMHDLLRRITDSFPDAYVLVTGYYRLVSTNTADNPFLRLLVKKLNNERPEARHMTDKEMRSRLIALSDLWYKVSTASLGKAVNEINAELRERNSPSRVSFVEIEFWPEHSFAASDTLLWNFMFGSTNLSGFRQVIVVLSLGVAAYKPNDEVRESRVKSCNEAFKAPRARKETEAEKRARKDSLLICRYASLGHPNQMGALIYAEAIKGQLQSVMDKAGWKSENDLP